MNFDNKTLTVIKGVYSKTVRFFVKGRNCAHGPNIRLKAYVLCSAWIATPSHVLDHRMKVEAVTGK